MSEVPRRFRVTVTTLYQKNVIYTVCTLLGERKAIALAAQAHLQRSPQDPIYDITGAELLPGTKAESNDIVDRTEW